NFCCVAVAAAAGKLLGLGEAQIAQAIAMALVPNNALRLTRVGHMSMWQVAATGHAGRAGIFAAQLSRRGMQGPRLPFEGVGGWCDHVARKRFDLETMGGPQTHCS